MSVVTATTAMIHVETGEYPVYMAQVRQKNANVSYPLEPTEDLMAENGYAVVRATVAPEGDVVTEGAPELVDGEYQQSWVVREHNEEEKAAQLADLRASLNAQVLTLRRNELAAGFQHTTDDQRTFGVQLRDSDRVNLLGLFTKANMLIAAGASTVTEFRSTENVTYPLTPEQLLAMAQASLAHYELVMQASWDLKDEIDTAPTKADLPEIPAKLVP